MFTFGDPVRRSAGLTPLHNDRVLSQYRKDALMIETLTMTVLSFLMLLEGAAAGAEKGKPAWKVEWERTLQAAKRYSAGF